MKLKPGDRVKVSNKFAILRPEYLDKIGVVQRSVDIDKFVMVHFKDEIMNPSYLAEGELVFYYDGIQKAIKRMKI